MENLLKNKACNLVKYEIGNALHPRALKAVANFHTKS